jgi:hypothetical protein
MNKEYVPQSQPAWEPTTKSGIDLADDLNELGMSSAAAVEHMAAY